ncbi:hypothetical protein KM043_013332 [Ampulex compressa]|nr:hypothetical protein KM043_013332 [Ampulex compressa]
MACDNRAKVYLGYEDEYVADKHRPFNNFMTNKIGGHPNCHDKIKLPSPQCRLCGLHQLLALQLYAPLDNSKYHRTLYIYTCINPNCWNHNESWTCLRAQSIADESQTNASDDSYVTIPSTTSWLSDADNWGDNLNDNAAEQNGNNMLSNNPIEFNFSLQNDTEDDIRDEFSALHVDDPNANSPASVESPIGIGAVARLESPQAFAEIDGEESEVIDSNIEKKYCFVEIFLSVDEEDFNTEVSQHVRDLLVEYQYKNPELSSKSLDSGDTKSTEIDSEKYEKGIPKHGDEMFHNFLCRIQKNPGQILRYSRDNSAPLLLYPINGHVGKCRHCGSGMIFEVQVLPTIIPKLILYPRSDQKFQIEFGTILIYTCIKSCWSTNELYKEEHVIVQAERL